MGRKLGKYFRGDCIEIMATIEEDSIDAIVTDPPYLLGFMGKEFDKQKGAHTDPQKMQAWYEAWAKEAFQILKPGGHLVAFGGTRTYHRLACAIEDAGFEIRDSLHWVYAQGFPKGHRVDAAIDKHLYDGDGPLPDACDIPRTAEGAKWDGYNVALKPSHEPIVLARKPLIGTVAENVLAHGCGALNVDGCRVVTDDRLGRSQRGGFGDNFMDDGWVPPERYESTGSPSGRWPPNLCFTHHPECRQTGTKKVKANQSSRPGSGKGHKKTEGHGIYSRSAGGVVKPSTADPEGNETVPDIDCHPLCPVRVLGDTARFFPCFKYQAKASKSERSLGLPQGFRNKHPTVKPLELMRWLVRLVTPPDGIVLDPFLGSGTTSMAAVLEGFYFVGIEIDRESMKIAKLRTRWAVKNRK